MRASARRHSGTARRLPRAAAPAALLAAALAVCGDGLAANESQRTRAAKDDARSVEPEDLVALREAGDAQISPDGRRVAFVIREPADPKQPARPRNADIWVVSSDGGAPPRRFTSHPAPDTMPRWSPDGHWLAFISERTDDGKDKDDAPPRSRIFLLGVEGGEAEVLTREPGMVERFRWSADGTQIAFTLAPAATAEEEAKIALRDDAVRVDRDDKNSRLWIVRLADRAAEALTPADLHVSDFDWSPDGGRLAVKVSPSSRLDDVYYRSSLLVVGRSDGRTIRTLSPRIAEVAGAVRWSPDGRTILFASPTRNEIAFRIALIPAEGGETRFLLDDYQGTAWFDSWPIVWEPDSKHFLTESIDRTGAKLLRVDAATGETAGLAEATPPFVEDQSFSVDAAGRSFAYMSSTGQSPPDVWALRAGGAPRRLTDLNPQVGSLRLGETREVSWKNGVDGTTLYGVLILPPGSKPGRPLPTVVQIHGGPEWAWWNGWHGSWHEWGQLLASNGYAVFLPNPRGSYGQGNRFLEANRDAWGGMDFRDIMDGVDALVAQKIADPGRLGIGGWSYGGFMTSWAVTQTRRFKAAVMGAGVSDLFSMNGTSDIPTFLKVAFLDTPYARREAYERHSAMTFVTACKTPTLVLHGQADARVPVGQSYEFYRALQTLGVETEMVVYPREHHPIEERAHQIDLQRRVLDWYNRHLR